MATPTEYFRWYITDERTGKRRLTTYAMTRADAVERFPDAEPDLGTREVRDLPEPGEMRGNTRPPGSSERSPGAFLIGRSVLLLRYPLDRTLQNIVRIRLDHPEFVALRRGDAVGRGARGVEHQRAGAVAAERVDAGAGRRRDHLAAVGGHVAVRSLRTCSRFGSACVRLKYASFGP